jgi:hypothetical protein
MPARGWGTLITEVTSMRTLRNFIRFLADLPRGSSADGRSIGLGLDAALKAQRARGAEAEPLRTRTRPATEDRPYTRA